MRLASGLDPGKESRLQGGASFDEGAGLNMGETQQQHLHSDSESEPQQQSQPLHSEQQQIHLEQQIHSEQQPLSQGLQAGLLPFPDAQDFLMSPLPSTGHLGENGLLYRFM